jgi:hypothetical protein
MDQSPMLNSRKRPSAAICISANMFSSAASQWISLNRLARVINLPRWGDPGCDRNATTANFVLCFRSIRPRFDSSRQCKRLFYEIKFSVN